MGKNSATKTLSKRIGNTILHKLLVKHTNRPESRNYLHNEELAYRDASIKDSKKYNWNEKDKQRLMIIAVSFIESKKNERYSDVKFSLEEAEKLIEEEIKDLNL